MLGYGRFSQEASVIPRDVMNGGVSLLVNDPREVYSYRNTRSSRRRNGKTPAEKNEQEKESGGKKKRVWEGSVAPSLWRELPCNLQSPGAPYVVNLVLG
ncbi:hypothetical protein ElyMa_000492600 [Elysia marginata]|uniref:Uncharacterized protein n=1 Tax=Elysia marginata TaxID=1093978 RepID=A0AAV4FVS5_9GAST|nr:hypothetical protein ElyMa_000492600 [Elysia marginata]